MHATAPTIKEPISSPSEIEFRRSMEGEWMVAAGKGNKNRFSEEQIKSLESMFATQAKLEPRQKLQLARELGLQPRQVAIWFQNKRARRKSKQLERQYAALRADYDALLSSYDQLKHDKLALLKQLEKLTEILQEPRGKWGGENADGAGGDERSGVGSLKEEFVDAAVAALYAAEGSRFGAAAAADDDTAIFLRASSQPPAHPHAGAGFAAAEHAHQPPFQFHSSWPPPAAASTEQTCSSSQWWEFESLSEQTSIQEPRSIHGGTRNPRRGSNQTTRIKNSRSQHVQPTDSAEMIG